MRVFVGCSAKESVTSKYRDMTSSVCTMLANCGHKLVFGGIDVGMMGTAYMTFKYEGKKVKAITDLKNASRLKNLELDAYEVKPTIFDRTKEIFEASELYIFLPGGIETLGEIFSILDAKITTNDTRQIVLFNFEKYYDSLLNCLRRMYLENFISEKDLKCINVVSDVKSLELFIKNLEKKGNDE